MHFNKMNITAYQRCALPTISSIQSVSGTISAPINSSVYEPHRTVSDIINVQMVLLLFICLINTYLLLRVILLISASKFKHCMCTASDKNEITAVVTLQPKNLKLIVVFLRQRLNFFITNRLKAVSQRIYELEDPLSLQPQMLYEHCDILSQLVTQCLRFDLYWRSLQLLFFKCLRIDNQNNWYLVAIDRASWLNSKGSIRNTLDKYSINTKKGIYSYKFFAHGGALLVNNPDMSFTRWRW